MKLRILSAWALAACACGAGGAVAAGAAKAAAVQTQQAAAPQQDESKVSGDERKAAEKINKAQSAEAKLQAASEFFKKHPQSVLRPRIAEALGAAVLSEQDERLKASLAETYKAVFNRPGESDRVEGALLAAYINTGRTEEAYRAGQAWLAKNPDDVDILRNLTILASNESIKGNNKFVEQGRGHGRKALELIEADKRPADFDAAKWEAYKASSLPTLYRELGVLATRAGDKAAAKAAMEKAASLKSSDPAVYLVLSEFAGQDYEMLTLEYKATEGPAKQAVLQKVQAHVDKMIDLYARAVASMDGNAQYQPAVAQLRQDLESNYKYRHNNSTEGMQQLIDKYKQEFAAARK